MDKYSSSVENSTTIDSLALELLFIIFNLVVTPTTLDQLRIDPSRLQNYIYEKRAINNLSRVCKQWNYVIKMMRFDIPPNPTMEINKAMFRAWSNINFESRLSPYQLGIMKTGAQPKWIPNVCYTIHNHHRSNFGLSSAPTKCVYIPHTCKIHSFMIIGDINFQQYMDFIPSYTVSEVTLKNLTQFYPEINDIKTNQITFNKCNWPDSELDITKFKYVCLQNCQINRVIGRQTLKRLEIEDTRINTIRLHSVLTLLLYYKTWITTIQIGMPKKTHSLIIQTVSVNMSSFTNMELAYFEWSIYKCMRGVSSGHIFARVFQTDDAWPYINASQSVLENVHITYTPGTVTIHGTATELVYEFDSVIDELFNVTADTNLKRLEINRLLDEGTYNFQELQLKYPNLKHFELRNCFSYTELVKWNSLSGIVIESCPVKDISGIETLEELTLTNCYALESVQKISNVSKLHIKHCKELKSITNVSNVSDMQIKSTNLLLKIHNISHVENLSINAPLGRLENISNIHILDVTNLKQSYSNNVFNIDITYGTLHVNNTF